MKHFVALFLSLWLMTSLTSCTSYDETSKRIEYTQIIEKRAPQDILNDLYVASDGDTESLARILQITPSSIERIRKGETNATVGFEEKLKEVAIYYNIHGQSFSKLQSALDGEYSWYDSILNFPSHHPFWFWGINIVLLLLAFIPLTTLIANGVIILEVLVFLVAWLCSLIFSPSGMEDKYTDTVNPVIEQKL